VSRGDPFESEVFSYRVVADGRIFIQWHGREVTILKGKAAERFLTRISGLTGEAAQLVMAKVTGNFKRGNERAG
jgi:hypothetical protein